MTRSGSFTTFSSANSTSPSTSLPLKATLSFCRPKTSAIWVVKPLTLPPPPTTKTALTDLPPFNSLIFSAISSVIELSVGAMVLSISSEFMVWVISIISLNSTFEFSRSLLISSAVLKSTRQSLAIISVISSPA